MTSQKGFFNRFNIGTSDFVTPGKQLEFVSLCKPESTAVIVIDQEQTVSEISWRQLHIRTNQLAWMLKKHGVEPGGTVLVSFPNGIGHILATLAIWKAGACYMPVSHRTTGAELAEICRILSPAAAFSELDMPEGTFRIGAGDLTELAAGYSEAMPPDVVSDPNMISLSGGTSGKPKLIRQNMACGMTDEGLKCWFDMSGMDFEQRQLLTGPLFHGAPHTSAFNGLFAGGTLVIPRNLCPDNIVRLIRDYQIEFLQVVPTLLNRILKLPGISRSDFESVRALCHTGGICSPGLKQALIDLLGPEKVYEIYSMTEVIGLTAIRGDDWLQHRGSVGRPVGGGLVSIRDENGRELPPGEIGEIYMTPPGHTFYTEYIGQEPLEVKSGGFRSVGDIGWVCADGYLYFADRRSDMIVTGGENVFVAEVENALLGHGEILDAVVVGLPDEEWGRRLHAVIEAKRAIPCDKLKDFLRQSLLPYKIPKTFEFVDHIRRRDNGKIVRREVARACMDRGV